MPPIGFPPLPMPGPYDPNAGPPLGGAPGALTTSNYLNQQLVNVNSFDRALASTQPPLGNGTFPGGYYA